MNETALKYEYIIRAAHQVGRLEILAAHADAYRALERNFVLNRDNNDQTQTNKRLFEYAYMCGEIATNFQHALEAFEKNVDRELDERDQEIMGEIDNLLVYPEMDELDEVVEKFEELLIRHNRMA